MSKFHVGDLVRVKEGLAFKGTGILGVEKNYCGKMFRVKRVIGDENSFSVNLDKDEMQYVFSPEWLEPVIVGKERIVIRHDGKTVTAMLYNGKEKLKEGKAKCHPDDPFDFVTGAKLALDRLAGGEEKKPEYKAGDFVVVKKDSAGHHFPVGSVVKLVEKFSGRPLWQARGIVPVLGDVYVRAISERDFEPYKEEDR